MIGGVAGASAPYLAMGIKHTTDEGSLANYAAHGVLGAGVAALQGNSALAGGLGAAGGEYAANTIREHLYNNRNVNDLTESEKQNISNLSQLASGLTVATISGGNMSDAGAAISASKNAVENNFLAPAIPVGIAVGESIATCFATGPCTAFTIATATAFAINLFSDETLSDENKKNNNSDNNAPTQQLHNSSTSSGAAV